MRRGSQPSSTTNNAALAAAALAIATTAHALTLAAATFALAAATKPSTRVGLECRRELLERLQLTARYVHGLLWQ